MNEYIHINVNTLKILIDIDALPSKKGCINFTPWPGGFKNAWIFIFSSTEHQQMSRNITLLVSVQIFVSNSEAELHVFPQINIYTINSAVW